MSNSFRLFAILLFVAASGAAALGEPRRAPDPIQKIEVRAQPIEAFDPRDASRLRFGSLAFRGGLVLTSPYRHFGGLSGLRVFSDGARFVAVTDRGHWLRARIGYRDGRPVAIEDAEMAPILGADGRPLNRRGWYDAESIAMDNGTLYVGIERVHEIVRFDFGKDGLRARGRPIPVPQGVKALPSNRGLECLALPARGQPLAGTLIAISERGLDRSGNIQGFLIGGAGGTFTVRRTDEFDVSDCTITPDGDLLLLERRFSWTRGVAMRIRRVALSSIGQGAVVNGPELILADMGYQIDNMEGISVHRAADGALVLTLVSDDNFSIFQRTLLLQFVLTE